MNFIELMSANVVSDNKRKTATTISEAMDNVRQDCLAILSGEEGSKTWVKELKSKRFSCTPNINKHSIFKSMTSGRVRFATREAALEAIKALVSDIDNEDANVKKAIKLSWQESVEEIQNRNELMRLKREAKNAETIKH
jgi:DNA-directed RNA polymerase alpha subunit